MPLTLQDDLMADLSVTNPSKNLAKLKMITIPHIKKILYFVFDLVFVIWLMLFLSTLKKVIVSKLKWYHFLNKNKLIKI